MGVTVNLSLQPHLIDAVSWKKVYQETLSVLPHCGLIDVERPEGAVHEYAVKPTHVDDRFSPGCGGWTVHGTMQGGRFMTWFSLSDNIDFYRKRCEPDSDNPSIYHAIFASEAEGYFTTLWDADGADDKMPLSMLAIACLLCHRFPDAIFMDGEATAEQCQMAVDWINPLLTEPIDLPIVARADRFLRTLRSVGVPEENLLSDFFEFSFCGYSKEVGQILIQEVGMDLIEQYYQKNLFLCSESGMYHILPWGLMEYLSLGLDFKLLCRMVLQDQDILLIDFFSLLIQMQLHVKDKETRKFKTPSHSMQKIISVINPGSSLLRVPNRNVDAYLPAAETEAAISEALGEPIHFRVLEAAINRTEKHAWWSQVQDALFDLPDSVYACLQNECLRYQDYEICGYEDLIFFEPGMRIYPALERILLDVFRQLHERSKEASEYVFALSVPNRKAWFDMFYPCPIPKQIEDELYCHLDDEEYILPYTALYTFHTHHEIVRAALFNPKFLRYFWDRVKTKHSVPISEDLRMILDTMDQIGLDHSIF